MSCNYPMFVLQELPDVTDCINYPIQNVQRIKYTCFDVSRTLIAIGATSGGVYVFNRNPCEFIQLIPNKDGTITRIAISPDEKRIAFANGRGTVTVADCDQSRGHSEFSKEHQGNEVTAMLWGNSNMLYVGDDVGRISVMQLQSFITKTMFHSLSQLIMSLDSRICQLDTKDCLLLVSTLTRTYICDTSQEQYRQIGQKTRDGEYGACFVDRGCSENVAKQKADQDLTEFKKYNIVDNDTGFAVGKELENTFIYCARPSSRLWEASVDGTVIRTHQFKQVLGQKPMTIISAEDYDNECVEIQKNDIKDDKDTLSVNFPKVYSINGAIFSYRKNSLYFLNVDDVDNTIWFEMNKDIIECRILGDIIYVWTADNILRILRFLHIEKFLVKCYVDEKYELCIRLCESLSNYLLTSNISTKLHLLTGLKTKMTDEKLKNINNVLERFDTLKTNEATIMKSGIYVVENSYNAQSSLVETVKNKLTDETKLTTIPPEALQTLKDLSISVTDKFTTSKKILKEKWDEYEKKHRGSEKPNLQEIIVPKRVYNDEVEHTEALENTEIVYKESSQNAIEIKLEDDSPETKLNKSLYQYYKLKQVGRENEKSNLTSIIENYSCDINMIYNLILQLEQYCLSIDAIEESKLIPNNIFLNYLNESSRKDEYLDKIINDEVLYKYFVDSCIVANITTQKLSNLGCECGFPLPYTKTNKNPEFSELIDQLIEKQWSTQNRSQCYDICKRMPYLWRKILYLRRNEDLLNVLSLLLQMLDETLLHSFLPQFTLDTWDSAIKLYATLQANMCLNCNKKFDNICVKEALSWDDIGALVIKSIGGKNAMKLMEKYGDLIATGDLTLKFYHASMIVSMFEKVDASIVCRLVDAVYSSYKHDIARIQIYNLLKSSNGLIKDTSLPIEVAAISTHWGLSPLSQDDITLKNILDNIPTITNGVSDCILCGLPLQNEVLFQDGGLRTFICGHTFHGACLNLIKVMLCTVCMPENT